MTGQDVKGLISADSRSDVMAMLTQRSLFPMTVAPAKQPLFKLKFNRPIKADLLAATLTQLSDLLTNGVPLLQALDLLAQQATHDRLKEVLSDVRGRIADGKQLHEAMGSHRDVFSDLTLSIIRAGTEGAFLEASLQQTAEFLERQEELRAKILANRSLLSSLRKQNASARQRKILANYVRQHFGSTSGQSRLRKAFCTKAC